MKVGYLMTVFPHQGHLWFWREVCWMKAWDVPMRLYATRHAEARDKAEHGWAAQAESETTYLWPMSVGKILAVLLAGFFRSPIGFIRSLWLGLTSNVDFSQRPRWKSAKSGPRATSLKSGFSAVSSRNRGHARRCRRRSWRARSGRSASV